jgi:hypothetical protein
MATMYPSLDDSEIKSLFDSGDIKSKAEVQLYKAFRDKLPQNIHIFFEVTWILRNSNSKASDGETDFLIFHPDYGYICLEVKGGGIEYDANKATWYSINSHQERNTIKDPVKQAADAKWAILEKIKENPDWKRYPNLRIEHGHAVFFPDVNKENVQKIESPKLPKKLIGYKDSLNNLEDWLSDITSYWNENDTSPPDGILSLLQRTFARSFEVQPLISQKLEQQKQQRLRLTNNQMRLLDYINNRRRAAISGGAGTGKTLLAVEKAKRLANDGFKTLLTCYNKQLGMHLESICKDIDNLEVKNFHYLCSSYIQKFKKEMNRDLLQEAKDSYGMQNQFDVLYPVALSYAADSSNFQFDAIVCDEGQDFKQSYWEPLELLLNDYDNGPLYVFFDDNQNIYSREKKFPITEEPFLLKDNCRNTSQIHHLAYKYYKGDWVDPPQNMGTKIMRIHTDTLESEVKKINMEITNLITNEKVSPGSISVLLLNGEYKEIYYNMFEGLPLPKPAKLQIEWIQGANDVLVDTVKRYKGLESEVVFLCGLDGSENGALDDLIYVGTSRAKSLLYLVGKERICDSIIS